MFSLGASSTFSFWWGDSTFSFGNSCLASCSGWPTPIFSFSVSLLSMSCFVSSCSLGGSPFSSDNSFLGASCFISPPDVWTVPIFSVVSFISSRAKGVPIFCSSKPSFKSSPSWCVAILCFWASCFGTSLIFSCALEVSKPFCSGWLDSRTLGASWVGASFFTVSNLNSSWGMPILFLEGSCSGWSCLTFPCDLFSSISSLGGSCFTVSSLNSSWGMPTISLDNSCSGWSCLRFPCDPCDLFSSISSLGGSCFNVSSLNSPDWLCAIFSESPCFIVSSLNSSDCAIFSLEGSCFGWSCFSSPCGRFNWTFCSDWSLCCWLGSTSFFGASCLNTCSVCFTNSCSGWLSSTFSFRRSWYGVFWFTSSFTCMGSLSSLGRSCSAFCSSWTGLTSCLVVCCSTSTANSGKRASCFWISWAIGVSLFSFVVSWLFTSTIWGGSLGICSWESWFTSLIVWLSSFPLMTASGIFSLVFACSSNASRIVFCGFFKSSIRFVEISLSIDCKVFTANWSSLKWTSK